LFRRPEIAFHGDAELDASRFAHELLAEMAPTRKSMIDTGHLESIWV
jgi:hypothetical protein